MADSFSGILIFALLVTFILMGTIIRARFKALGKTLIPASLIGGIIGFILVNSNLTLGYTSEDFTVFTFHFFTLSFMSLVLTGKETQQSKAPVFLGGSWLALIWVISLGMQAILGLGVIQAYNLSADVPLSEFLGIMVTHGFTQGPGQAIALGDLWQNQYGISHAMDFGLIYASIGFIMAFIFGIPIARWAIRKQLHSNSLVNLSEDFEKGLFPEGEGPISGRQITQPANVDSLVFHLGILGFAYLLTDQWLLHTQVLVADSGFENIFSHNLFFFHGLIICVILRSLIDRFGYGQYIDNETQKRITGSSVDLMVAATLISIQFSVLLEFIVPISLVCIVITLATALLCFGFASRLQSLGIERGLTTFGCCCGSTGSGLLLLRILDPNLTTPIAKELAFFNIAILFLSFHILVFMAPILPAIGLIWIALIYIATIVIAAVLLILLNRRIRS